MMSKSYEKNIRSFQINTIEHIETRICWFQIPVQFEVAWLLSVLNITSLIVNTVSFSILLVKFQVKVRHL